MWHIRLARNLISLMKQQINLESWCNIAYCDVVYVFIASSSISLMRQSRNLESCDTTKPALTFIWQICVESCDESSLCIVAPSLVGMAKEVDTPTLQHDGTAGKGLRLRLAPHNQIRRERHCQDQLLVEAGANFTADMHRVMTGFSNLVRPQVFQHESKQSTLHRWMRGFTADTHREMTGFNNLVRPQVFQRESKQSTLHRWMRGFNNLIRPQVF